MNGIFLAVFICKIYINIDCIGGYKMNDTVNLVLRTTTIDKILELLDRKIEKVEKKEIDEAMVEYLKELKDIKSEIETQVS